MKKGWFWKVHKVTKLYTKLPTDLCFEDFKLKFFFKWAFFVLFSLDFSIYFFDTWQIFDKYFIHPSQMSQNSVSCWEINWINYNKNSRQKIGSFKKISVNFRKPIIISQKGLMLLEVSNQVPFYGGFDWINVLMGDRIFIQNSSIVKIVVTDKSPPPLFCTFMCTTILE